MTKICLDIKILLYTLHEMFFVTRDRNQKLFLKEIDGYKLIKSFDTGSSFTSGIYQRNKKEYFVKIWQGKRKNQDYCRIKNEFEFSRLLYKYNKCKINSKNKLKRQVSVAKPISLIDKPGIRYTVYEYLNAEPLINFSDTTKFEVYSDVISHFGEITEMIRKDNLKIPSPNRFLSFFTFPIFVLLTLKWNPNKKIIILKMATLWAAYYLKSLGKPTDLVITHKDLHLKNILVQKNKVYLIDLEFMCLEDRLLDPVNTLRYESRRSQGFVERLSKMLFSQNDNAKVNFLILDNSFRWGYASLFKYENSLSLEIINKMISGSYVKHKLTKILNLSPSST